MTTITLSVQITTAWWLSLYLRTLSLFCLTMGTEPDMAKVERVAMKAIRIKLATA